jgi:tetratricopeptide (TPR) repeat protein
VEGYGLLSGIAGHGGRCRQPAEKAIEYNAKALELDPRNAHAWHNMGLTYLESGRPEEAIRCFEEALTIEDRADTRLFLEQAYEGMKD